MSKQAAWRTFDCTKTYFMKSLSKLEWSVKQAKSTTVPEI